MRRIGFALVLLPLLACGASEEPPAAPVAREGRASMDDGVELYYRIEGRGEPTLVVPVAVFLSEPLRRLAESRRVVFFDARHRGRSGTGPLDSVSLDRQVRDLEGLRRALDLDSMDLLGWSGPAMEVGAYTIRHPDRVRRLIQVSPVPPAASLMQELGGDSRGGGRDQAAIESLTDRWERGEVGEAQFCREHRRLSLPASFADTALVARVPDVCAFENEWPVNLWPYFDALLGSFADYDLRPALAELRVPRLVIHGREDGIPIAGGRAWVEGYPNARFLELSPAGHFPFIERPEEFFRAVEDFLGGPRDG
ncbi:MAG: alpha/beta fold hydrolase [Gemmatimonadales bacterium]